MVRREWVGLVLWEEVEQGAKAERSLWMTRSCVWAARTDSRLTGGEQRGHEPRHGEMWERKLRKRVEGEDDVGL